jgi:hypothetical protein
MKIAILSLATLALTLNARADFSYTSTMKMSGGMASAASGGTSKHYLKGQKMKTDTGDSAIIMDFEAQTMTMVDNTKKTYHVTNFSDMGQALKRADQSDMSVKVDVKETGQRKSINGFNASEVIMTMEINNPTSRQASMKMQMEMDIWISTDVPGSQEMRAFYQKNSGRFPWQSLTGGANPSMQQGMAEMQRKMSSMNGVPVLQVTRMKSSGNDAQMAQRQQAMEQSRARFEEMKKQGGKQAELAEQMLARMGAMSGGSMFETTTESSNFSTGAIPDAVFAIPAGYQKTDH